MPRITLRPYVIMGILIVSALVIVTIGGLVDPSIYAPFIQSDTMRAGLPVQDAAFLLVAPLLGIVMFLARRGSRRALVVWAGLLLSVAYYYAFYVFGFVYTLYYPLYLALVGLSFYSLLGLLAGVDLPDFAGRIAAGMPVRLLAVILGITLLFVPLWLLMIWQGIQTQEVGEAALVYALDLAFLIPAMLLGAVQIWRRRPVGYLLGGVLLVKAAFSGILLTAGSLLQIALGFSVGPDFAMYVFLLVAGLAGLLLYLRHVRAVQ